LSFVRASASLFHLFTSDFVMAEVLDFLSNDAGSEEAARAGRHVRGELVVSRLQHDEGDVEAALAVLEGAARRRKDSFTDASSVAIMRRYGLDKMFSFDGKFVPYGFTLYP
jgi:predicted nucleic acid-binding protein